MNGEFFYSHRTLRAGNRIPDSAVRFSGIFAVFSGKTVYTVDGTEYTLTDGDVICLRNGCTRSRRVPSNTDEVSIHFCGDECDGLPVCIKGGATRVFRKLAAVCDEIKEGGGEDADARIEKIASCMARELAAYIKESSEDPVVKKIKVFLQGAIGKKVTLADVGRHVGFSPNYCQYIFKKVTGKTVIDSLIALRVGRAKELLAEGGMSLSDIAVACGFSDHNYFARVFRERTGQTPLQYRKFVL